MSLKQACAGTDDRGLHFIPAMCKRDLKMDLQYSKGVTQLFPGRCQINSGQAFKKQLIPAEGDYSAVSKVSVWSAPLRTGSHETNGSRVEGKSDVMWWRNCQVDTAGEGAPILVSHSYVLQTTHKSFINNRFFFLAPPATLLLPCFWLKGKNQISHLLQNKFK